MLRNYRLKIKRQGKFKQFKVCPTKKHHTVTPDKFDQLLER
jgi:hypothetical protein